MLLSLEASARMTGNPVSAGKSSRNALHSNLSVFGVLRRSGLGECHTFLFLFLFQGSMGLMPKGPGGDKVLVAVQLLSRVVT